MSLIVSAWFIALLALLVRRYLYWSGILRRPSTTPVSSQDRRAMPEADPGASHR